ncbi:MAG: sigma-70 family RNA polymerase sigma factor [Bacteroidota bacterium]
MTTQTDQQLLDEFLRGDERSFNELVHRYQGKVYWVARRMVIDHDEADDIVQEVFIKLYQSVKEFRGESSLYTWLYRVTVNASLNALRRKKVREYLSFGEARVQFESDIPRPDELYERTEQSAELEKAIASLPEKQRAVFVLRYYEEKSYEEISKLLKTSIGGLKANYFHAVKKIGKAIRAKDFKKIRTEGKSLP